MGLQHLLPLHAKVFRCGEWEKPAAEMDFNGQIVEVLGPDNPATAATERIDYGECLMRCRTLHGDEFVAFETELEDLPAGKGAPSLSIQ